MWSLFRRKPTFEPKPMFKQGDKIRIVTKKPATPAIIARIEGFSNVGIGDYCSITSDSYLFYDSETKDRIFFRVSTNYLPRVGSLEAPHGSIVYFEKEHFNKLHYVFYKRGRAIDCKPEK